MQAAVGGSSISVGGGAGGGAQYDWQHIQQYLQQLEYEKRKAQQAKNQYQQNGSVNDLLQNMQNDPSRW